MQDSPNSPTPSPVFSHVLFLLNIGWLAWVLSQFYFSGFALPFSVDELKIVHLGGGLTLLSLALGIGNLQNGKRLGWLWILIALTILAATLYFFLAYDEMVDRVGMLSTADIAWGGIFVLLVVVMTWKEWGMTIPVVVLATLLYAVSGQHLGGLFRHSGIDLERLVGYTSTYFMGTLGSLTSLSATMIFHFILFGALLQCLGGFSLIEKLSRLVCSRFASGASQTAIYSSAFIGMMTGSAAANVAVTGSFTIPMMKSRGYDPNYAGAVEAVASTGGQILPPVMGVGAFIMASLVGLPYAKICIAALLPAIIYFLHLSFSVTVRSCRLGMKRYESEQEEEASFGRQIMRIFREHGHLLIPIVFLTWRIFAGESPARAAVNANFLMIGVAFLHALVTRRGQAVQAMKEVCANLYKGLLTGGKEGAKIALVLGALGIIVDIFTTTGFGQRLSHAMIGIAGGNVFILVSLAAVLTLFFGMGMPTPGAYMLTVLLSAPVLINFGFPELSVHMFVFYFAVIAAITPPVAMASLVAVGISGGSYISTCLQAVRLGLQGFLLPVFFLFRPETLALESAPLQALISNGFLLMSGIGMTFMLEGFFIRKLGLFGRLVSLAATAFILYPDDLLSVIGSLALILIMLIQLYAEKNGARTGNA